VYSIPANEKSPTNKFLPFSTASAIQLNSLNQTEAIFVKLFTSNTKCNNSIINICHEITQIQMKKLAKLCNKHGVELNIENNPQKSKF
jgi:hypothetical protein